MTKALNLDNFDQSVRPQDDLYDHVNGNWLKNIQIPDDKSRWGSFDQLRDESEQAVKEIITSLTADADPSSEASLIANLYQSFMDEEQINQLGVSPLTKIFAKIDAISSLEDLCEYFGWSMRHGLGELFEFAVEVDPGEPTRYLIWVEQSGISLPDESYYREDQYSQIREEHEKHIATMFELAGFNQGADRAKAVMQLSTEIAACHWDNVRTRDYQQMYYPQSWKEFKDTCQNVHWDLFAKAAHLPQEAVQTVINTQRTFPADVAKLIVLDRLADWKNWARWMVITSLAPFLSEPFVQENFNFYSKTLLGVPKLRDRWKRGVSLVESVLGEAIGKEYVKRHFDHKAKEKMDQLVANLLEAYRQSITELDWMGDETRAQALDKLAKFTPKIGYPDKWRDYSGLNITAENLVGNVIFANHFEFDYEVSKLGKPVDPTEWEMFPQTVNAYYHPLRNEIVFPAAILQPPFFNPDADDALNYGGIGAVIGHEIGHGFDDQGSSCDGDGRLRNWWTDEDHEKFKARTQALIGQYDQLCPPETPELHVNGKLTIGENIGDLGGLSIAYKAWKLATEGVEPETIDGLSGAERLFMSWAAIWATRIRPDAQRERIATDPHSPERFRCNQTVRNIDVFHEVFQTKPGDKLWLAPEDRVRIW